jgi:hypothetical protein
MPNTRDAAAGLQTLEDIESVRKLKALYCYLVDAAVAGDLEKWNEFLAHFVEDAWIDFEGFGRHEGKEAIGRFYRDLVGSAFSYSAHMVANPLIEVDGANARGSWYVHVPFTLRTRNEPGWLQGKYEEEYLKVEGHWKWKSITTRFDFITPYHQGWVRTPFFTP